MERCEKMEKCWRSKSIYTPTVSHHFSYLLPGFLSPGTTLLHPQAELLQKAQFGLLASHASLFGQMPDVMPRNPSCLPRGWRCAFQIQQIQANLHDFRSWHSSSSSHFPPSCSDASDPRRAPTCPCMFVRLVPTYLVWQAPGARDTRAALFTEPLLQAS
jgi:hypothetical protein